MMANFKHVYDDVPANSLLNFIKEQIEELEEYPFNEEVETAPVKSAWEVIDTEMENGYVKELIVKRNIPEGRGEDDERPARPFYGRFVSEVVGGDKKGTFYVQQLENYEATEEGILKTEGPMVKWQCVDEDEPNTSREEYHAIHVSMNINNDRLMIIIQADPTINNADPRIAHMYFGETVNFEENKHDPSGNVALTAGCVDEEPTLEELQENEQYFGKYTSAGNNSVQMLGTKTGVRYQTHRIGFITHAPKTGEAYIHPELGDTGFDYDRHGGQGSRHLDGKYTLSPLYISHFYDGMRSTLSDCFAVNRHNVLNQNTFVVDVDKCKYPDKEHDQEVYRYYEIDTEQNFFNTSPNKGTSIAVLVEVRYGEQVTVK